ncbi:MAG TPA: SMP-30/gluconolactonase/LRE family protein [Phycisphaerae bacterium]|nr:SMP-30/gluconolactonase/LRE family protein [Phycisphaerae bacterium]
MVKLWVLAATAFACVRIGVGATTEPGRGGGDGAAAVAAPGAALEKREGTFSFTEGPACDSKGNVFFTDQPNDVIYKFDAAGKLSVFLKPCGRSNGLCFDAHDNLIACADEMNQLWSIAPDGSHRVLVKDFWGKLLNGPNDVWLMPELAPGAGQAMYITDPLYKRDYWKRGGMEQPGEYVYWVSADGKTVKPVARDLKRPNGIIGTPDGKTLYVSDIGDKKTYSYSIQPDGTLAERKLFCTMGSDGMTIDSEGNVYLTGKGVTIFSAGGEQIGHIDVPEKWTGNICFGGADRDVLFITASTGIYTMRMRVHGVGSQ